MVSWNPEQLLPVTAGKVRYRRPDPTRRCAPDWHNGYRAVLLSNRLGSIMANDEEINPARDDNDGR